MLPKPVMPLLSHQFTFETHAPIELIEITGHIAQWIRQSNVREGLLMVMSPHTTARIHLNEQDPALQRDMVTFLQRLAPADGHYAHNADTVDGRANAHAHLLGLCLNATETIPVVDGGLQLGEWQSLFLIELDGPRASRTVALHFLPAG